MLFSSSKFFCSHTALSTSIACFFKASKPAYTLLALIPFFFGVQQFAEGLLWVLLPKGGPSNIITAAMYIFLSLPLLDGLYLYLLQDELLR